MGNSLHPETGRLLELETLKTWSLIVTLFGDLEGRELTGSQIRNLLGHVRIRPEAIRTALYRLKSDGWIDSEKQGREALYKLSEQGHRKSHQAISTIYEKTLKFPDGWQFSFQKDKPDTSDAIAISKDLYVIPVRSGERNIKGLTFDLANSHIPDWFAEQLMPENLVKNANVLIDVVSNYKTDTIAGSTGKDALVLRLLVLHHWRKLALRPGCWAYMFYVPDGVFSKCQNTVTTFLHETPRLKSALL